MKMRSYSTADALPMARTGKSVVAISRRRATPSRRILGAPGVDSPVASIVGVRPAHLSTAGRLFIVAPGKANEMTADSSLVLVQIDLISDSVSAEFITDVEAAGATVHVETRENEPMASVALYAITALVVYLAKPFIDAHLKRAADEVANVTYPAIKGAIQRFVKRLFHKESVSLTVVTSTPGKIDDGFCLFFSVLADTKFESRVKFAFTEKLDPAELDTAIAELLKLLIEHHTTDDTEDDLSRKMLAVTPRPSLAVMIYDRTARTWMMFDPRSHLRRG